MLPFNYTWYLSWFYSYLILSHLIFSQNGGEKTNFFDCFKNCFLNFDWSTHLNDVTWKEKTSFFYSLIYRRQTLVSLQQPGFKHLASDFPTLLVQLFLKHGPKPCCSNNMHATEIILLQEIRPDYLTGTLKIFFSFRF